MKDNELQFERSCHVLYSGPCKKEIRARIAQHYPEAEREAVWEREELRAAMALLAPEQRLILSLRVENDLSYTDIAAVLGVREGTVKSRLARARDQLRKKLSQSGNKAAAASSNPQKGGRGREL